MLGEFTIDMKKIRSTYKEFEEVSREIKSYKSDVASIRNQLSVSGQGTYALKQQLKEMEEELSRIALSVHNYKECLEDIVRYYGKAEANMGNSSKKLSLILENSIDMLQDSKDWLSNALDKKIDEYNEIKNSLIGDIEDSTTRNGFTEEYRNCLQQHYDDVADEYKDAKALYDKYINGLVMGDFYGIDDEGNSVAYHSGGKIFLNTDDDLSNARGDGTTFYHEYGHFVVYNENWINNGACTGKFNQFEKLLREEISTYVNDYEEKFRKEGIEKGYTDTQLDKYIENETRDAIELDINGSSNETYNTNNGISDIIDGVTNGNYQPSYGHDEDYWNLDQTRVANEAFAQIFSAQMTGDETELNKMRELMPETYEYYMEMIKSNE